jgi:ribonuclease PH
LIRQDGRAPNELRKIKITKNYLKFPEASVLIEAGETKIICTATVAEGQIPAHLQGTGKGWISAEYSMLPRATISRTSRTRTSTGGRAQEIQRIIGRALRAVVDLSLLGERSILIDCDVLQADGSTRTLSITGGYLVLVGAIEKIKNEGKIITSPIRDYLAAVSVGICNGEIFLDLAYEEDSHAEVDLNIALTGKGELVEIQGTAEEYSFSFEDLSRMLVIAKKGINEIIEIEKKICLLEF